MMVKGRSSEGRHKLAKLSAVFGLRVSEEGSKNCRGNRREVPKQSCAEEPRSQIWEWTACLEEQTPNWKTNREGFQEL